MRVKTRDGIVYSVIFSVRDKDEFVGSEMAPPVGMAEESNLWGSRVRSICLIAFSDIKEFLDEPIDMDNQSFLKEYARWKFRQDLAAILK